MMCSFTTEMGTFKTLLPKVAFEPDSNGLVAVDGALLDLVEVMEVVVR